MGIFNFFRRRKIFSNFTEFMFNVQELEAELHKIYLLMNNKFIKQMYFETEEKNQKIYKELIESFIGVLNPKLTEIDGFENEIMKNKEISEVVDLKKEIHEYISMKKDKKIKIEDAKKEAIYFEFKIISKYKSLKDKSRSHALQDLFLTLIEAHTNQIELIKEIKEKK